MVFGVIAAEKRAVDAAGDAVEAAEDAVVGEVFAGFGQRGKYRVKMDPYRGDDRCGVVGHGQRWAHDLGDLKCMSTLLRFSAHTYQSFSGYIGKG